MKDFW